MMNENPLENSSAPESAPDSAPESDESFGALLSEFERTHTHKGEDGAKQLEGTVVSISAESVFLDIGYKIEGVLPRAAFENNAEGVVPGDRFPVSVKGRNEEGYYDLSRVKLARVTDWSSLEEAFAQKLPVAGKVTGVVKGGLSVDIGVRAFLPASRSGTRDADELAKLVDQEITCRIIKLDVSEEDVVVDRRIIVEEQARSLAETRYSDLKEGDIVSGQVRNLANYGAFVDLGGIDGLLHVSDISWSRVGHPEEVLSVGQEIQGRILKIDRENRRISIGLKQLQPEPWDSAGEKYSIGQRITGTVTRLADFGAFVEVEPGIEGLIHVSEMSWVKKVRRPSDILKQGDTVEAVILSVNQPERRLSLGLKQALGDPWADAPRRFAAGSVVEGPVVRLTKFGAFVQLAEGVEGLIHVSEISAEKRINHPQDVLKVGQSVKALVLAVDTEKRQIKLSMKQLTPTSIDEYLEEHNEGDVVSGRVVDQSAVELGEGVRAVLRATSSAPAADEHKNSEKVDLSALTSMLKSRWKGETKAASASEGRVQIGQVRSFRIVKLNRESSELEVELV
ncbi:MAG TPA: 30S ribosomal protein S1 [Alloacidobacterium sp.]|nr:30S ribosomal protein S1 [Alloacidobacterium sp.]